MAARRFKGGKEGTGGWIPLEVRLEFSEEETQLLSTVGLDNVDEIIAAFQAKDEFDLESIVDVTKAVLFTEIEENPLDYVDMLKEALEDKELAALKSRKAVRIKARKERQNRAAEEKSS